MSPHHRRLFGIIGSMREDQGAGQLITDLTASLVSNSPKQLESALDPDDIINIILNSYIAFSRRSQKIGMNAG